MKAKANIITKTAMVVLQGATTITVADISQFPEAPNYATLINTLTNEYETVIYTGKSGNSLTGCTRGVEGTNREWDASTSIGRFFTAKEWNDMLATVDNKQAYVVPEKAGNIAVLDAEGKLADSGFLPGAVTKIASAPLTEEELITFMETLDDGIYAIETLRNGSEILMKGVVTVVNIETELEEQILKYARYISNGTSYEWNSSFEEWNLAAGAGGGGGGGSVVNPIRLYPYPFGTDTTLSAAVGNDFKLSIQYQNSQLTTGVLRVYRNTNLVLLQNISIGVTEVDLTQHLRVGSNTFDFTVTDALANSATVTYLVSGVSISITSSFNDELIYGQDVDIAYSVVGEGTRVALITLDGETVEYPSPTVVNTRSFTGLSHGVHTLSIQAKTTLSSGSVLFSNILNYNIIAQEVGNSTPIISSKFNTIEAQQGAQLFIDYIVYREGYEALTVNLSVDGAPVGEVIADRSRQRWNISNLEVGERTLTISCAGVTKEFVINIIALDVEFTNVEDSFLKLYLNASSKTNSDVDRTEWNNGYGDYITTYLNDFNYSTNGWIDGALDFSGRASATIMHRLFQNEVTAIGKTIEFELETNNDLGQEKVFLSCMNGGRGIEIKSDRAILKSSDTTVITLFKENEKIKISFVIDPYNGTTTTYINGVMSGIDRLSTQSAFKQASPQTIAVNMSGIGGKLYNVRVYERALTYHEILQNYLFDITDISEKLYQYNFSDIYDSVGNISIDKVKERIPVMVIRTYGVDQFGNQLPQTSDYRPTVDFTIEHPYDHTKDYTATNVVIRTQGTSTLVYPVKNYRLTLPVGASYAIDASKTRPTRVLNIKTDYMESSLSTNVGMCRLVDAMYDSLTPIREVDPLAVTSTYGYPIAVFNNNGTDVTFVGLYNLNTDKSDPQAFGHYAGSGFPDSRKFEVLFNAEDHAVAFTRKPGITDAQWFAEVTEGFEGNYPKQDSSSTYTLANYQPLMDMLEFVSNYVDVTPETEEAYKAEFLKRIDFDYATKYMLTCFILGAVDSFGKDLMCNTWGVENNEFYKWYFTFYDLDTCIGLDNQGKMVAADGTVIYDYDIELEDAVFAQASSRLWEVLTTLFKTELEAKYASMRATSFTFDNIWSYLYDEQISKFSKAMYNSNAQVKYVEAPGAEDWLWMLNGDRINQMKRWITNRLDFLDSKYGYQASGKTVIARISTSDLSQISFTLTSDIHYWMSMKLGNSDSGYDIKRTKAGEPVTLNTEYGASSASFMELTIFNAQHLVDLGDIGLDDAFDLNRLNISAADKIRVLNLGKETTSTVLDEFIIGNNTDLEELNLRNNSALGGPLNLSGCTRLKKLDLRGTSYTSVILPEGGILEECHLPSTITNVTLKNQQYLDTTNFTIEDGAELSLVRVENCPSVDIIYLLGFATADANVRILGTELSVLNNGILDILYNSLNGRKGIDSDGSLTGNYVFYGSAKVLKTTEFNNTTYIGYFPNVSFEFILGNEGDEYFIVSNSINARGNYDMVAYTGTDKFVVIPDNIIKTKFSLGTGNDLYDFGFTNWGVIDAIDVGVFASGIYTVTIPDSIVEINTGAFTSEYDGYILTELSTVPSEWNVSGVEVFTSQTTQFFEQDGLIIGYNPSGVILARCLTDEDDYTIPSSININAVPTDVYKIGSKFFTTYKNSITNIYIPAEITTLPDGFTTGFANDCMVWVEVSSRPVGWNSNWNSAGFEVIWSTPSGKRTFNIYDGASVDTTIVNYGITESMRVANFLGNWIYSNADLTDSISYPYFGSVGDNNLYLGLIVANATYTYDNENYKVTGFDTTHFDEGNGTVKINIAASYDDGVHGAYPVTSVASEAIGGATGNSTRSAIKEIIFAVNVNFYPDGLPAYAFANLDYCESIVLPAGIETIPTYCFYNCNLNNINLTDVVTIGAHAIENNNLTNLTIDQTTISIGDSALAGNQLVMISMYPYGCELGDNLLTTGDTFKTAYLGSSFGIYEGTQTGSWTRTGALPTPEEYFTFNSLTGTITDYNSAGGTEVIIPPQIGGVDVLAIGEGAFQNNGLTSIYIVDGITAIENYAIADNGLASVSIPNSVTYIGANAFKGLSEIDISLGTGFTSYICYVDDGATLVGHISTCEDSSFTIPDGVSKVSENAFDSALFTKLTIPESVTIIEDYAFVGSSVVEITMYPLFDEITIGDYIISSVNNDFRTAFISGSKGVYELIEGVWSRTGDIWEYIVRLSDFTYTTNATTTLITDVNSSVTTVNIPAILNGKPTVVNSGFQTTRNPFYNKKSLTSVVFQNGVAFINNSMAYIFQDCTSLTTAPNIPNSVTDMFGTFSGCRSLTTAPNIPNSVIDMRSTFSGCRSLTTAPNIPNSVIDMRSTFSGCRSLTTAPSVIGNSVTSMASTFSQCYNLTTAPSAIPNSVTDMAGTFYDCWKITTGPSIPNSVTSMASTFSQCSKLTTAPEIPNSVTDMSSTFNGCSGLRTAPEIPNFVTNMSGTFYYCTSLGTAPEIPNSVTDMTKTFYSCEQFTTAPNIPDSVTNMTQTFDKCYRLTTAQKIGNSVTNMSSTFNSCSRLTTAPNIPNSVTDMFGTFSGCNNLTTAPEIPNSVTDMFGTFSGCNNLTTAPEIPNSVKNMSSTFFQCTNLTTAPSVIGNSVTNMRSTFLYCSSLTTAPIIPNSVTTMYQTLAHCTNLTTAPEIPNSVTDMYATFIYCSNLTTAPEIPNSVTSMVETFSFCSNLAGNIIIKSNKITVSGGFANTFSYTNSSLQKDVYIPFTGFNATHNTKAAADAYNLDGIAGVDVYELEE